MMPLLPDFQPCKRARSSPAAFDLVQDSFRCISGTKSQVSRVKGGRIQRRVATLLSCLLACFLLRSPRPEFHVCSAHADVWLDTHSTRYVSQKPFPRFRPRSVRLRFSNHLSRDETAFDVRQTGREGGRASRKMEPMEEER